MPPPAPQHVAAAATATLLLAMLLHRRRRKTTPSSTPPQHIRPLPDFATLPRVGWRWERWKTADENWLDLAYLVARASEAKDGHMGCCIVRDPHGREPSLISTTINCGIYGRYRSDLHAEAAAVSDCARRGEKLEGCTLYVTRAPCPRCHCLIAAAGIRRVVAPTDLETEACVVSAEEFGRWAAGLHEGSLPYSLMETFCCVLSCVRVPMSLAVSLVSLPVSLVPPERSETAPNEWSTLIL